MSYLLLFYYLAGDVGIFVCLLGYGCSNLGRHAGRGVKRNLPKPGTDFVCSMQQWDLYSNRTDLLLQIATKAYIPSEHQYILKPVSGTGRVSIGDGDIRIKDLDT